MGHHGKIRRVQEKKFEKVKRGTARTHTCAEAGRTDTRRLPMVTMRAGVWVHVENYGVMTVYETDCLKLAGEGWRLHIDGEALKLVYFTEDDLLVAGRIRQVRFV